MGHENEGSAALLRRESTRNTYEKGKADQKFDRRQLFRLDCCKYLVPCDINTGLLTLLAPLSSPGAPSSWSRPLLYLLCP